MKNDVYISTGAFTGRINGRNYRLAIDYSDKLECDGYEFMIFTEFYDEMDKIVNLYISNQLKIPVMHFEKNIGDLLSTPENENLEKALEKLKINCEIANKLGTKKAVLHAWGIPLNDTHTEMVYERAVKSVALARKFGIDLLIENCFCVNGDPIIHMENLAKMDENIGFIVDTRCAQFHGELNSVVENNVWKNNVRHVHVNDYKGGYRDWNAIYPIYQPTLGDIDWTTFFDLVRKSGYKHSFTLEASRITEMGVDWQTLNASVRFIRSGLQ